jgi:hypothetical protein
MRAHHLFLGSRWRILLSYEHSKPLTRQTKRPVCVASSARPGQHETECCSAIYFAFNKDFAPVRFNDLFHDREA